MRETYILTNSQLKKLCLDASLSKKLISIAVFLYLNCITMLIFGNIGCSLVMVNAIVRYLLATDVPMADKYLSMFWFLLNQITSIYIVGVCVAPNIYVCIVNIYYKLRFQYINEKLNHVLLKCSWQNAKIFNLLKKHHYLSNDLSHLNDFLKQVMVIVFIALALINLMAYIGFFSYGFDELIKYFLKGCYIYFVVRWNNQFNKSIS